MFGKIEYKLLIENYMTKDEYKKLIEEYMNKFKISYTTAIQIIITEQINKFEKDLIYHIQKHLYKHIMI